MSVSQAQWLLTIDEVAARLALHHRTVRRLIESGDLRVVRIGRAVRVQENELERFIAEREAP